MAGRLYEKYGKYQAVLYCVASNLLMNISQDERDRTIFRSRKKFQMNHASDIATVEDRGRREAEKKI